MCGIAGLWDSENRYGNHLETSKKMGQAITHRGPDDSGAWFCPASGVSLSHQRLSILDLSSAGHQPMHSSSKKYVIVFNGEIYNHKNLRKDIEKKYPNMAWRGNSDTETLLAGFETWGIEDTLKRTIGMFAFALWDTKESSLTLARDRMGEKPLYYGWQNGVLLFGSELKALKVHPAFEGDIDRNSLTLLMRHNYIPSPYSIYSKIKKLLPGTFLTINSAQNIDNKPTTYWDFSSITQYQHTHPFTGTENNAIRALEQTLMEAVGQQMIADVPLGAFLSGGIDSSVIASLMQAQSSLPVKTFSIGFNEPGYNEAEHAKAVAKHLGTDHTELYVTSKDAINVIPQLPFIYDEPFSDSSQIPTYLLSQLTRQHVTVSLSGDGGDELFGGYNRYLIAQSVWSKLSILPKRLRLLLASLISSVSPGHWNKLAYPLQPMIPNSLRGNTGDRLHKAASLLAAENSTDLYRSFVSHWSDQSLVLNSIEPSTQLTSPAITNNSDFTIHRMMALDSLTYLPDDILCKVDRAAMRVSLETRVPFLDHRVVELAWRFPLSMKIRENQGKWLLRQVLYKHVPKNLIDRPKMGFGIPLDTWLRGPLRDWAESLLNLDRLNNEGFLNPVPIRKKWHEHLSGKRNWQYHLWDILMFQSWLEAQNQ